MLANSAVGIMLDLDSILDTRKGTIKKLFPELHEEIKNSPKYYLRKEDKWDDIDPRLNHSQIVLNYQGRDLETIKNSQLTMISRLVMDLINRLNVSIQNNDPNVSSMFLVINFYPYRLPIELKTNIAKYLAHQLGINGIPIGEVDMEFKFINPAYLKENNIKFWYCYHYAEWLRDNFEPLGTEKIDKDIEQMGCPDVTMIAPRLANNQKAIDEFIEGIDDCPYVDQFDLTRSVHSNIIRLEFMDASVFSTIDIEKLVKLERRDEVEKSEVLCATQLAVKEISERLGEPVGFSQTLANNLIEDLEQILFDLKVFNTKEAVHLFKNRLAALNLNVAKLYNATPFNSGEDLEDLLNGYALSIDTSEEDYLKTEAYWNGKGVATIKNQDTISSGEVVYRCICAEDNHEQKVVVGDILSPERYFSVKTKPADIMTFLNYFEN